MKKIKKTDLLITGLIGFVAIIYISFIFNDSVWGDEAYTMIMLKKDFIEIVKATASDVHPPLYYFIAKIFTMIFGYSVATVKLASITPVIFLMFFVKNKSKKLFGDNANLISILFILLIGFCPKAFSMNVELRMYTWAMFFVTCSGIFAYELYKNPDSKKVLLLFILSGLGAAYTHYYAALTECLIYIFLIISLMASNKKNWKICLKFVVATVIGYIPWLPIFIKQFTSVKEGWWLTSFRSDYILDFIKFLFTSEFTNIFLILITSSIIGLLFYIRTKKKDTESWFALLAIASFIITVLIGCIVSKLIRPMFLDRYMYPAAGMLFLGISIAVCKNEYKNLWLYAFIGVIILNLPFSYNEEYIKEYKTGTEDFKKFIKSNIVIEDEITTDMTQLSWTVLPYYLPNNKISTQINSNTKGYIFTEKDLKQLQEKIPNANIEKVSSENIDSVYYFNVFYAK